MFFNVIALRRCPAQDSELQGTRIWCGALALTIRPKVGRTYAQVRLKRLPTRCVLRRCNSAPDADAIAPRKSWMNNLAQLTPSHCPSFASARLAINGPVTSATYARMFPELPPFEVDEAFLHALGRSGGQCDCGDIDDSSESLGETAAGWPIFGQFVAHDITADRSTLRAHTGTAALRNARSPQLNLECLYGDGPIGHPFLYQRNDPAKFVLGAYGTDLQRNSEGIAVIGDPRNDSHTLMAQLHLAMLKLHNGFVDEARRKQVVDDRVFDEAARQLRWHYQWCVLHEFLPDLVGQALAGQVLDEGPRWLSSAHGAFIPLEFAHAAFRYGHCQIRNRYLLN